MVRAYPNTPEFAARVSKERRAKHWTAKVLADRCADLGATTLSRSTIAKIESGVRASVYDTEVDALAEALSIDRADLIADIVSSTDGSELANVARHPPRHRVPLTNVPPANPRNLPRRNVANGIHRTFQSRSARVLALAGIGGVGKTQLAINYAQEQSDDYDIMWWIDSEEADLIRDQVGKLALRAGWVDQGAGAEAAADAAMAHLHSMKRWLLIFDNVQDPKDVAPWIPAGSGHVLITSRSLGLNSIAQTQTIDVLHRDESIAMLRARVPALSYDDADRFAAALGDLPLALAQGAGVLAATEMTAHEYLAELDRHAGAVLSAGVPASYSTSLAAVIRIAVEHLRSDRSSDGTSHHRVDPQTTIDLLLVLSLFGPEPVPIEWLRSDALPQTLAALANNTFELRRALGRLSELGLIRVTHNVAQMHRLTRLVLQDTMSESERRDRRTTVETVLSAAAPRDDAGDPHTWPSWSLLLPHLLNLDPGKALTDEFRRTACQALWYLIMYGEYRMALNSSLSWRNDWLSRFGPNDDYVLWASNQLGHAYRHLGQYEQAYAVNAATLERRRHVNGPEDIATLASQNGLANTLRALDRYTDARELDEDTLAKRRRILGEDHVDTLRSATNLATDLLLLGRYDEARAIHEETLTNRQRVLGPDHPDTLASATFLALTLRSVGQPQRARELDEEAVQRYERVLGPDHPHTLRAENNLSQDLEALGDLEAAHSLQQSVLERRARILGPHHPDTLETAASLATTHRRLGNLDEALQLEELLANFTASSN